jgi:hypothetical protein
MKYHVFGIISSSLFSELQVQLEIKGQTISVLISLKFEISSQLEISSVRKTFAIGSAWNS